MFLTINYWQWGLSGVPLALLLIGLRTQDQRWLLAACWLAAVICFFAWIAAFRRVRTIADIPTSSIASAAQGYVELQGHIGNQAEYHLVGKSGLICVWFSRVSYRQDDYHNWHEFERQTSESIFQLQDASGAACLIDPEHAEVISNHQRTWYQGDIKYVEKLLIPGQPLYVLGEFTTLAPDHGASTIAGEVAHLLKGWKQDPAGLLEHFDSNRDGKIDFNEWEQARQAAHRQVTAQNRHFQQQPGIHLISRPKDRRLFLLSNLAPQQLRQRYLMWSWLYLLMFFAALGGGLKLALLQGWIA